MDNPITVDISLDSADEITKASLIRMYIYAVKIITDYNSSDAPMSSYAWEDYDYNKELIEALKVVIRYITSEDERPEGI